MDVGGEDTVNSGGGGEGDLAARYERDLVHKLKLLRHELSLQQPQAGHCRIEVSREEIFEVGRNAPSPLAGASARVSFLFPLNPGVISADNEDEAQRPEEASDGEVQGRGGSGLWWGGQVMTRGKTIKDSLHHESHKPASGSVYIVVVTCPDASVECLLTMWLSVGSGCTCCVMKC